MLKGLAMRNRLLAAATVGLAFAIAPAAALASDDGLQVQDACDPATFNAVPDIPQPACTRPDEGGPRVTFDGLIAQLVDHQSAEHWRFKADRITLREGQPLNITMTRGGEAHTITEVPSFGLGCVPQLNALVFPGQDPTAFPAACADPATFTPGIFGGNLIAPGMSFSYAGLSKRTHRFQCMIHPWMRTTVTVR
jgi:hypothetical protein